MCEGLHNSHSFIDLEELHKEYQKKCETTITGLDNLLEEDPLNATFADKIATASHSVYQNTIASFLQKLESKIRDYREEVLKPSRTHIVSVKASESALKQHKLKLQSHTSNPSLLNLMDLVKDVHSAGQEMDLFTNRLNTLEKSILSNKWCLFKNAEEVSFEFSKEDINKSKSVFFTAETKSGPTVTLCVVKEQSNDLTAHYTVKAMAEEAEEIDTKIVCSVY